MNTPQGMAYGYWHFPCSLLREMTFEIQIAGDLSRCPGRYLQMYQGRIATIGFYCGLQTDLYRPSRGGQGHGLIFSRWCSNDEADAREERLGWIEASPSKEGGFVGVRAPFAWTAGNYTCALRIVDEDAIGVWYEFSASAPEANRSGSAGQLRFPKGGIESGGSTWVEVYSGARAESDVPLTTLRMARPEGGPGRILPVRCDTDYHPDFASSDAHVEDGQLVLTCGGGTRRKHPKQEHLL